MKTTIVRYKVKEDRAEENKELIRAVFAGLDGAQVVHYSAFVAEDNVSFTHVATFDDDDAQKKLTESDAFKVFVADIKDRCVQPPQAVIHDVIGVHGVDLV